MPGIPYQTHSLTSRQAAEAVAPYAKKARYQVYVYIREHRGVSDEDIVAGLGMNPNTERPRRVELEDYGLIRQIGVKPTQASGSEAATYEALVDIPYPAKWPSKPRSAAKANEEVFLTQVRELAEVLRSEEAPNSCEAKEALWQAFLMYAGLAKNEPEELELDF